MDYRRPDQLERGRCAGGRGLGAAGTQLAEEIHRSGRPVTIAVGEHIRAPRVYRGRDIKWWMDVAECWTIGTTRSTTSAEPATCRHCSWLVPRTAERSISIG